MTLSAQLKKGKRPDALFAKLPARIYLNRDIKSYDRDVYGVIAIANLIDGPKAAIRQQAISEFLHISIRQVRKSVAILLSAGEIEVNRDGRGVNGYTVTTPSVSEQKAPQKPLLQCGRCAGNTKWLSRAGWCHACMDDVEATRLASQVVRVIGPDVGQQEIAQYLQAQIVSKRVRKMAAQIANKLRIEKDQERRTA